MSKNKKSVVYIIGPMSGVKNFNHELFNLAEKALNNLGFVVLNPANLPLGLSYAAYMEFGLTSVKLCDFIYELPESEKSRGATLEKLTAELMNKPVIKNLQHIPAAMYEKEKPFAHLLHEPQAAIENYRTAIMFNA